MSFDNSQHEFYKIDKIIFRAYIADDYRIEVNVSALALKRQLGDQYARFVQELARGQTNETASERAGFSAGTGHNLARRPEIIAALHAEVSRLLIVEDAPIGRRVLRAIALDETAPKGVRADCAKTLLSRAGHGEPRGAAPAADTKELTAMSQDELRAVINDCEGELGARATPIGAPHPAEPVDIFE